MCWPGNYTQRCWITLVYIVSPASVYYTPGVRCLNDSTHVPMWPSWMPPDSSPPRDSGAGKEYRYRLSEVVFIGCYQNKIPFQATVPVPCGSCVKVKALFTPCLSRPLEVYVGRISWRLPLKVNWALWIHSLYASSEVVDKQKLIHVNYSLRRTMDHVREL